MNFIEKYKQISAKNNSYVCVGLDSEYKRIPQFLKEKSKEPVFDFNKKIIDVTKKYVCAYKPNFAFYIARGETGIRVLKKTIDYIPAEIPIILDIKVGDIGNTMRQYAKAAFDELKVDAITANPLMGKNVIEVFKKYEQKYIFLLALTSNPSNQDFLNDDDMLYEKICKKINSWGLTNLGAVVGATNRDEIGEIRLLLPRAIFLLPGLGAQGGDVGAVMKNALASDHPRIVVNSSRSIIFASDQKDYAIAAGDAANKLRQNINSLL